VGGLDSAFIKRRFRKGKGKEGGGVQGAFRASKFHNVGGHPFQPKSYYSVYPDEFFGSFLHIRPT